MLLLRQHTLIRSLLFLVLIAFSANTSCSQNTPENCGSEPASPWYQETVRRFLDYLHIDKPINIYKLDLEKKPESYVEWCLHSPHAIWVNELHFERFVPDYKLWLLAKEIVAYKNFYEDKAEKTSSRLKMLLNFGAALPATVCGVFAAAGGHYLLSLKANAIIKNAIIKYGVEDIKIKGISQALALAIDIDLPQLLILQIASVGTSYFNRELTYKLVSSSQAILYARAKKLKKGIDVQATHMLLDLGNFSAVELCIKRLAEIKAEIVKEDKPSVHERIDYLQECVKAKIGSVIQIEHTSCAQQASDSSYTMSPEPVLSWYKEKAHEFLGYLHVNNPHDVPVYKFNQQVSTLSAHAGSGGIGINEATMQNEPEHQKIFTVAHEAAHYSLQHAEKDERKLSGIDRLFDALCALPPFLGFFGPAFCRNMPLYGKLLVGTGVGFVSGFYVVNRYINLQNEMNAFMKLQEKEADLCAARMLCEHGYQASVEERVQEWGVSIKEGAYNAESTYHPSLYERHAYLSDFMEQWKQRHQKAFLSDN